jgi:hypothetical protein
MENKSTGSAMTSPDGQAKHIGFVTRINVHPNFVTPNRVHFSDNEASQPSQSEDSMNTPTREEFNLKFETMELRMDGRVASIEAKINAFLDRTEANEKILSLRLDQAVTAAENASGAADRASSAADRAASSAERSGGLKSTMWLTSITTILAVLGIALAAYFGTQQSNIGIVQATIAAFESGKSSGGNKEASSPVVVTPQPASTRK